MRIIFIIILCNLFSLFASANNQAILKTGYDPQVDIISEKYHAGEYLIYDCDEGHWVCVLEEYFKICEENREQDLIDKDKVYHTCAPISKFQNKISCFQRQLFLSSQFHGSRFCVKNDWKLKAVN